MCQNFTLVPINLVQDGRIITGQNPQLAAELGQVLAKALKK